MVKKCLSGRAIKKDSDWRTVSTVGKELRCLTVGSMVRASYWVVAMC